VIEAARDGQARAAQSAAMGAAIHSAESNNRTLADALARAARPLPVGDARRCDTPGDVLAALAGEGK